MKPLLILCYRAAQGFYQKIRKVMHPVMNYGRTIQIYHELPELARLFDEAGIRYWLGGGIAYDAMRGYRTRLHKDIDISVLDEDISKVQDLLESAGFKFHHSRCSYYAALRRGLKIDVFAWKKVGEYREQIYDRSVARVFADVFEQDEMAQIGDIDVRLSPAEVMHVFLPLVRNQRDQAFILEQPCRSGYRFVKDVQEARQVMDCLRIEPIPADLDIAPESARVANGVGDHTNGHVAHDEVLNK